MNAASVEPNLKHSFLPVLKKSPASIARANASSDCFPFLPSPGIQESQPNRDLVPAELRAEACAANRDAFRCLRLSLTKRPAPIRPVSLMSRIRIRPLKTEKEFRACEEIQREVWGASAISAELLSVMQKYGGAVLGAMAAGEMAGFLCAFLAKRKGKLIHWSHMMAVRPRFRDRGLGFRMKLLHRQLARDQGLRAICWTFDPLQSRNAKLNVGRLGVQIEEYIQTAMASFPAVSKKAFRATDLSLVGILPQPRWNAACDSDRKGGSIFHGRALMRPGVLRATSLKITALPGTFPLRAYWWKSLMIRMPCASGICASRSAGGWKRAEFFNITSIGGMRWRTL